MQRPTRIAILGLLQVIAMAGMACAEEPIEHPRPDLRRDRWVRLDGTWSFRFDPRDVGREQRWYDPKHADFDRAVRVPFCWESNASGIAETQGPPIGWYRRTVEVPQAWANQRVWLCFGAVDYAAEVWVDGQPVGGHEGGYDPFRLEITEQVRPGTPTTIVVRAVDRTDPTVPLGNQGHGRFTPVSGIWQPVWLEATPATYIEQLRLTPLHLGTAWTLEVEVVAAGADGPQSLEVRSPDRLFASHSRTVQIVNRRGHAVIGLTFENPRLWTPEQPHLYQLDLVLGNTEPDVIHTYFGLRTFACSLDARTPARLLLNDRPIRLRGAVHYAYYPKGLYTAASDAALKQDLLLARRLGLNALRLHQKAVDPRLLYWADRLGMMILGDIPGARETGSTTRSAWEATMRSLIARDHNHPSLIGWCLFQEGWIPAAANAPTDSELHDWAEAMVAVARSLTPDRLIIGRSASDKLAISSDVFGAELCGVGAAHLDTRLEKWGKIAAKTKPPTRPNHVTAPPRGVPLMLTSYSPSCGSNTHGNVAWQFRELTTGIRHSNWLQGQFYAALTDVPWSQTGLVKFDRTQKPFGYEAFVPGMTVADLQGPVFVGHTLPPMLYVNARQTTTVPLYVVCDDREDAALQLQWQMRGVDNLGRERTTRASRRRAICRSMDVVYQEPLEVEIAFDRPIVGALGFELLDRGGTRLAANYVNLVVSTRRKASPRMEILAPQLVLFRIRPEEFAKVTCDGSAWDALTGHTVNCTGSCELTYRLNLPEFIRNAMPSRLVLMVEMSSGIRPESEPREPSADGGIAAPAGARDAAGTVDVSIGGRRLWEIELDPAGQDGRGVLSLASDRFSLRYGELVRRRVNLVQEDALRRLLRDEATAALTLRAEAAGANHGLAIFGEQNGRYPIDLTIIVETARPVVRPPGPANEYGIAVDHLRGRVRRVEIIEPADSGGHAWQYRFDPPAAGWKAPGPDDGGWKTGRSAFGRKGDPTIAVRTPWERSEIWLRTSADLPDNPLAAAMLYRGGPAEIYLNGERVGRIEEDTLEPRLLPLAQNEIALLVGGDATIAVHAQQTQASPAMDLWLEVVEPTERTE